MVSGKGGKRYDGLKCEQPTWCRGVRRCRPWGLRDEIRSIVELLECCVGLKRLSALLLPLFSVAVVGAEMALSDGTRRHQAVSVEIDALLDFRPANGRLFRAGCLLRMPLAGMRPSWYMVDEGLWRSSS